MTKGKTNQEYYCKVEDVNLPEIPISSKILLAKTLAKFTGTALPTILYPSAIYLYLKINSSGKV
jgi:hypothetical protein